MIASVSQAEPPRLGRRIVRLFRSQRGALALIILTILTTSALNVISALLVRHERSSAENADGASERGRSRTAWVMAVHASDDVDRHHGRIGRLALLIHV